MGVISWKKAYGVSLALHLLVWGTLTLFMVGTVAQHEEEKMYVVNLDMSDLSDSGSGHAGGGGGGGSGDLSSLFPEKLSETAVAERTAQIEQSSSALASPNTAMSPIPDAVPESMEAAPSADSGSSENDGSGGGVGTGIGTGTGSGEGTGEGSGYGGGVGSGTGDGYGDGNGYGDGSGDGYGSGDSGAEGTGSSPFDTEGFWAAVNANKSYPAMAVKRGLTGTVYVTVTLDSDGNCIGASASGNSILAQAATDAVYAACPYPNPTGAQITINVPVTFDLQ